MIASVQQQETHDKIVMYHRFKSEFSRTKVNEDE